MIRRASRKAEEELRGYEAGREPCRQGEYWLDAEGNDLPPGNTYRPPDELAAAEHTKRLLARIDRCLSDLGEIKRVAEERGLLEMGFT